MSDSGIVLKDLRVDGGASVSNIMMQIQADMTGVNVNRPKNVETTALGAAYCAGLATGVWDSLEEIEANRAVDRILFRQWKFQSEIKNIPIGSVLLNAHAIGKDKIIKYIDIYHKRR